MIHLKTYYESTEHIQLLSRARTTKLLKYILLTFILMLGKQTPLSLYFIFELFCMYFSVILLFTT